MTHEFDAEIMEGRGGAAWVEVPLDVEDAFGSARPRARALVRSAVEMVVSGRR